MKNFISLPRLVKLFQMELRLHRKTYLTMSAIVFAAVALNVANILFDGGGALKPFSSVFQFWVICFAPFILYNSFVYHPTKGLTYAMLPATSTEKVLSAWIQCVVVMPVVVYATSIFGAFFADLVGVAVRWQELGGEMFFEKYLFAIVVQSLAFWGAFWFKHKKVAKTALTLALICVGFVAITFLISYILGNYNVPKHGVYIGDRGIIINGQRFVSDFPVKPLVYSVCTFLTVLSWSLAFFKFRRTQI